mmetsp:Transcript_20636/g.57476  ORF Transcript_20636/g.57476 Transcript_20636/m.57476 type:complete len:248 (+) Transcript_20636:4742-5485(+)
MIIRCASGENWSQRLIDVHFVAAAITALLAHVVAAALALFAGGVPRPTLVDSVQLRFFGLVALVVKNASHQRNTDDSEDHEEEEAQHDDVAKLEHRAEHGIHENFHLRDRVEGTEWPQQSKKPEEADARTDVQPLQEPGDDNDEIEYVPRIAQICLLVADEAPSNDFQKALRAKNGPEHVVCSLIDELIEPIVIFLWGGSVLVDCKQDGVDDDAEQNESVGPPPLDDRDDSLPKAIVKREDEKRLPA